MTPPKFMAIPNHLSEFKFALTVYRNNLRRLLDTVHVDGANENEESPRPENSPRSLILSMSESFVSYRLHRQGG